MSDRFFRFPLRALSVFETPWARLDKIASYCVMDVGAKHLADSVIATATPAERRRHCWQMGCNVLNVDWTGDQADAIAEGHHREVIKHCGSEAQATVSIRTEWLWECLYVLRGQDREKPVSYREFSVLCAILSKLGNKDLESCTWQEIQRRALGYTTEAEMKRMLPFRRDGAKALTRQQIRSTLDDLTNNRFFARHAVGNGNRTWLTYYSFKMDVKELETAAMTAWMRRRRRGRQPWTPGKKERAAKVWAMRHTLNGEGAKPPSHP